MESIHYCDICDQETSIEELNENYCKISDTAWCNDCWPEVEDRADAAYQRQKEEGND